MVVLLVSGKWGYAQRPRITDISEDFWNVADNPWKLIALG